MKVIHPVALLISFVLVNLNYSCEVSPTDVLSKQDFFNHIRKLIAQDPADEAKSASSMRPSQKDILSLVTFSAWDLLKDAIDKWGPQAFNQGVWLRILTSSALYSLETFEGFYELAPKNASFDFSLFWYSLYYPKLEALSYMLWETENVQKMITELSPVKLLSYTLPSPKFYRPYLEDPLFCAEIAKNLDVLAKIENTYDAFDNLKSSKIFCDSLKNTYSEEVAFAKYQEFLNDGKASVAEIFKSCYGF